MAQGGPIKGLARLKQSKVTSPEPKGAAGTRRGQPQGTQLLKATFNTLSSIFSGEMPVTCTSRRRWEGPYRRPSHAVHQH